MLLENQNTPYARVQNRAGRFVLPGDANFDNIGSEMIFPNSVLSHDWINVVLGKSSRSHTPRLSTHSNSAGFHRPCSTSHVK